MIKNNVESTQIEENFFHSVKKVIFFFKSELATERKRLLLFFLLTITVSIIDILCPYLTQQLIDIAIPQKNIYLVGLYSLEIIVSLLFAYRIYLVVVKSAIIVTEKAVYAKSRRLIGQILSKDPIFFDHYNSADIITRFANDLFRIGEFFLDYL